MRGRFRRFLEVVWPSTRSSRENEARRLLEESRETRDESQKRRATLWRGGLLEQSRETRDEVRNLADALTRLQGLCFEVSTLVENQAEVGQELLDEVSALRADHARMARTLSEVSREDRLAMTSGILKQVLPLLDGLETLSLMARNEECDRSTLREALSQVYQEGLRSLVALGGERFSSVGRRFDPSLHQVVEVLSVEDERFDGMVLQEYLAGYRSGDRVLRYAQVVVGRQVSRGDREGSECLGSLGLTSEQRTRWWLCWNTESPGFLWWREARCSRRSWEYRPRESSS
jgi:molecular chaperone GrpE